MGTAEDRIYSKARDRIFELYNQLQNDLIDLFTAAHRERPIDVTTMQKTAELLQNFPAGQQQCIQLFIQRTADSVNINSADVFKVIVQLATDTYKLIRDIFPSPDNVMEKFVTYIITEKLQAMIKAKLETKNAEGQEGYLRDLYELHKKTKTLEQSVEVFKQIRMDKVIKMLFEPYLAKYVDAECHFLRMRCTGMVQQYYDALLAEWGMAKQGAIQALPEKKDFFGVSIMTQKTIPVVIGEFLKVRRIFVLVEPYLDSQSINQSIIRSKILQVTAVDDFQAKTSSHFCLAFSVPHSPHIKMKPIYFFFKNEHFKIQTLEKLWKKFFLNRKFWTGA